MNEEVSNQSNAQAQNLQQTQQPSQSVPAFCKYCGSPIGTNSVFCPACGKRLVSQPVQQATPQQPQYRQSETQQPVSPQQPAFQQPLIQPMYQQPQQNTQTIVNVEQRSSNSLGTAGFVLALLAFLFSWLPVLNVVAWILWLLGLIFCIIGLFKSPRGMAIAGFIISFIDIIIFVIVMKNLISIFSR